jgi:hypothetical protein
MAPLAGRGPASGAMARIYTTAVLARPGAAAPTPPEAIALLATEVQKESLK